MFRQLAEAEANVLLATEYGDLQKALDRWQLTSFMFTVRPHNPHSPSEIAKMTGERLRERNVAKEIGSWTSYPGKGIKPDGEMKGIIDLAEAGYGQVALKGVTPDGHEAHIKKPPFYPDADKNLASQHKPREMRVYVEADDDSDSALYDAAARALIEFYGD